MPSLLLGAGVLGLVYGLTLALRPTVTFALGAWAGATSALVVSALLHHFASARRARALGRPADLGGLAEVAHPWKPDPLARRVVYVSALLTLVWMWFDGGSLGYIHDSLDYVAFVRRMLATDRVDLLSGSYLATEGLTPDPRRGAFHLAGAIVCRLTGQPPDLFWRAFPILAAPLAILGLFALTRRLLQSERAGAGAALVFVIVGAFNADNYLNNLGYASRLGWIISWGGLWAAACLADASDRRAWRAATALAALAAPILLTIHILSALQYLVALGALCLAWGWVVRRDAIHNAVARGTLVALPIFAVIALAAPLALVVARSYTSANPLFDHAQGLLYLAGGWAILGPAHLSEWFGAPGLLGIVLSLALLSRARRDRAAAYLSISTLVTLLIVVNPLAVALIERAGAHSVLFRIMWTAPFFGALGWAVDRALSSRRWTSAATLLAVALALGAHVMGGIRFWTGLRSARTSYEENAPLLAAFDFLEHRAPDPEVVVADPITSYQIPAYTRHYVMAPFNQHSSPADALAIERMQDAHAILNPWVSHARTQELLEKYDAEYVLLNQTYPRSTKAYYSFVGPLNYAAERAKFASRPDLFDLVYDAGGVVIFRRYDESRLPGVIELGVIDLGAAVSDADTIPPRPFRTRVIPPTSSNNASLVARALQLDLHLQHKSFPAVGGVELLGVFGDSSLDHHPSREIVLPTFRPGEPLRLVTWWRRTGEPITLPVESYIRVEWDSLPADAPFSKLSRQWREARTGEVLRFGRLHQPVGAYFPAYLWQPGIAYEDELQLWIPPLARPGIYRIRMLPMIVPYAPLYSLSDLWRDDDSLTGPIVARIRIAP